MQQFNKKSFVITMAVGIFSLVNTVWALDLKELSGTTESTKTDTVYYKEYDKSTTSDTTSTKDPVYGKTLLTDLIDTKPTVNKEICLNAKQFERFIKSNKAIQVDDTNIVSILKECEEKKLIGYLPSAGARFSTLSGSSIITGEVEYTDDVTFTFSPATQSLVAGESAVFDVNINWGGFENMFLSVSSSLGNTKLFKITHNAPIHANNSLSSFQVTIETSPMLSNGVYEFNVVGLTNGSYYTRKHTFSLNIERNDVAATDPNNNIATVSFRHSGSWNNSGFTPLYNQGVFSVYGATAHYDIDNNGVLDAAAILGFDDVPYPATSDIFTNATPGRAYADGSNIIVSTLISPEDFVVVHFDVRNGTPRPVLALVGNAVSGIIMRQDVGFQDYGYNVEGELPSVNGNGYIIGSINLNVFFYEGFDQNIIYQNFVTLDFSLALQQDGF